MAGSSKYEPGEWTSNFDLAMQAGRDAGRFVVVDWGKSSECGLCKNAWDSVFGTQEFRSWASGSSVPLLYADDLDTTWTQSLDGTVSDFIGRTYFGSRHVSFPYLVVLDPSRVQPGAEGAPLCVARIWFVGGMFVFVAGGNDSCSVKTTAAVQKENCPNAIYSRLTPEGTVDVLRYVFSSANKAAEYAVDVAENARTGEFGDYGTRTLGCRNQWIGNELLPRITLVSHASCQFQWFSFRGEAGRAYRVSVRDLVDPEGAGRCMVFRDGAAARNVRTFADARAGALLERAMSDGNIVFTAGADPTYILFARRDDEKEVFESSQGKEFEGRRELELEYAFSVSRAEQRTYSVSFADWDGTLLKEAQPVAEGGSAVPPEDPARPLHAFSGWSPGYRGVTSDRACVAQYEYVGYQNPRRVGRVCRDTTLFAYGKD